MIRLDLAVDSRITETLCAGELLGRSPFDRGKQVRKRITVVKGAGISLAAAVAPAAHRDSPLLEPTIDLLDRSMSFPEPPMVHLNRGSDVPWTPARLARYGLVGELSLRAKPAPVATSGRGVIERAHAWTIAHNTLVWWTER